jgi:hypothetical protein
MFLQRACNKLVVAFLRAVLRLKKLFFTKKTQKSICQTSKASYIYSQSLTLTPWRRDHETFIL